MTITLKKLEENILGKLVKRIHEMVEVTLKTLASLIPVGGALATAIYDIVKNNGLDKRRKMWEYELENRLFKMEATLNDLSNSEIFTTAIIKTTEVAMKTSSEEKLKYLANAAANSYEADIDETRFYLYMGLIERYTTRHISLMKEYIVPTSKQVDSTNEDDAIIINQLFVDGILLYSDDGKNVLSPFGKDFISYLTNSGEKKSV